MTDRPYYPSEAEIAAEHNRRLAKRLREMAYHDIVDAMNEVPSHIAEPILQAVQTADMVALGLATYRAVTAYYAVIVSDEVGRWAVVVEGQRYDDALPARRA